MAAPHTTSSSQREARKAEIARRHARGQSQEQIASALGMTRQSVAHWLKKIDADVLALVGDLAALKRRELIMLVEAEREAWAAWERSLADAESETIRTLPDATIQHEQRREGQHGDPAFLKRLIEISERRAKLLGLDAPTKQEVLGEIVKVYAGFDPDKI